MIYEFISPSDAITFKADDEKIAVACSVLLGNGKAACKDETGKSVNTMFMFSPDPMKEIETELGQPIEDFIKEHQEELANAFLSFAYGDIESRKTFDDALEAITDEGKKLEFKNKHEERNRTSMNAWVKAAWAYGKGIMKKLQKDAVQ